jgi:pilus assembly protein CpaC
MNKGIRRHLAAEGPHHTDRSRQASPQAGKARHYGRGLRRLVIAAAGAMLALAAAPTLPGFDTAAHAQRLVQLSSAKRLATVTVSVGKAEDVRLDAGFSDVVIGDADIADIHPITDKALTVLGKKLGTTRVSVYGEAKRLIGVFDVEVAYDTTLLQDELKRRFPTARIRVTAVNGRIMLTGSAPDGVVLDKAVTIAKQFGPEVINSVSVDAPQQVMLEVRFIEASRTAGRELGVKWDISARDGHEDRFAALVGTAGLVSGSSPFGQIAGRLIAKGLNIDVIVNALEERNLVRKLAEPNLVALSGDTASFLAGGEFPIPVAGDYNKISIEYKRFGVSLAFTPTVLTSGVINMKIEPEVSTLDWTNKIQITTTAAVPSLIVRRASTTVELRDGQSFVLAGLLQNDSAALQNQLPWIADVPVLGALFSSKSYQKKETDLVIIVTPRLVRPARPGDAIATPLDNTLPANDVDYFVNGKAEVRRTDVRATEGPRENPFTGHMLSFVKGGQNAAVR